MINPEGFTVLANKLDLKHQCYNRIYVITMIHKLLWKELLMLQIQIMMCMIKNWLLKIMHNLSAKFQKLIIHSLIIIFTLQCLCIIWLNIVIIIQTHQKVYGSLKETKFWIIMLIWPLIILNYLNIKQLL